MADKKDTLELELEEILGLWEKEHGKTKNEKAEAEMNLSVPEAEETENAEENPDEELSDGDIGLNEQELLDIIEDQLEKEPESEPESEVEEEPEPEAKENPKVEEKPVKESEVPQNIDYSAALEDFLTEEVITSKEEKEEYKLVTKKKRKKFSKKNKVWKVLVTVLLLILMILIVIIGVEIIIN